MKYVYEMGNRKKSEYHRIVRRRCGSSSFLADDYGGKMHLVKLMLVKASCEIWCVARCARCSFLTLYGRHN